MGCVLDGGVKMNEHHKFYVSANAAIKPKTSQQNGMKFGQFVDFIGTPFQYAGNEEAALITMMINRTTMIMKAIGE